MFSVFCPAEARSGNRKKGPKAAVPAASLRKSRREGMLAAVLVIWVPCLPTTLSSNHTRKCTPSWLEPARGGKGEILLLPTSVLWGLGAELSRLLQASEGLRQARNLEGATRRPTPSQESVRGD